MKKIMTSKKAAVAVLLHSIVFVVSGSKLSVALVNMAQYINALLLTHYCARFACAQRG